MSKDEAYKAGLKVRQAMFGKENTAKRIAAATDFNRPFEDMVNDYCFGGVWSRPGLSMRDRSIITLAALTALTKPNQIKVHIQGALANGVTVEEIREVIMHTSVYSGIPAGVEAMNAAMEILDKLDKLEGNA